MNKLKRFNALNVVFVCTLLAACTVQQARVATGTIPEASASTTEEESHGKDILVSLSDDYSLDTSSTRRDQLSSIFKQLAEAAAFNPIDWQVYLFEALDIADIRAVQGKYIFVWSGVFDVTESEDELAGLLACEIAHELARHTDPVQFNMASELLFGITDVAASVGLMVLTQGLVNVSGTGVTRWAYVEAVDLDAVDRVYSEEQVAEMAAIALQILGNSGYSADALLQFWRRAESNRALQERLQRLSRKVQPQQRVAILEAVRSQIPSRQEPDREPVDTTEQMSLYGEKDSI